MRLGKSRIANKMLHMEHVNLFHGKVHDGRLSWTARPFGIHERTTPSILAFER